jgi:chromosome segregation ATPase
MHEHYETTKKAFDARLKWCDQAKDEHQNLLAELLKLRESMNYELVNKFRTQDNKLADMEHKLTEFDHRLSKAQSNSQLAIDQADSFTQAKTQLKLSLQSLQTRVQELEESRVSIQEFEVKTGEIRDHCEAEQQRRQKMKRNLLTLENYTERYIPLTVLSTIDECFKPVFTDPIVKQRFQKKMDDMHVELSMQIIED